jgi:sirohydrochlorin ferrochelatase
MTATRPDAVLLVAHGSRRDQAARELVATAEQLAAASGLTVLAAFLEINSPSIVEGLEALLGRGARVIWVLPYFLNSGRHIVADVPRQVDAVRGGNREAEIEILPHVGSHPGMLRLLVEMVRR